MKCMFSKEMKKTKKNGTKLFNLTNKLAKIRSLFTYLNVIWHEWRRVCIGQCAKNKLLTTHMNYLVCFDRQCNRLTHYF